MSLFIHIGAPRTGTSFLRKWIFPYFDGVLFYNKQHNLTGMGKTVIDFFSSLSHYGDGDELSNSLNHIKVPSFPVGKKVIVSEEHLIWSVYHMMGNVGSRALLIKKYYPDAKIILTIRRQPEYFLSIFKYLQDYDNSHIKSQMKSIYHMLNLVDELCGLELSTLRGMPVGIKLESDLSLFDINRYYFARRMRHFISADFSWLRIYEIYAMLFGEENILILPQEMLLNETVEYINMLSGFIGSKMMISNAKLGKRENRSSHFAVFKNEREEERFKNLILNVTYESNAKLSKVLRNGYILRRYGYCDIGGRTIESRRFGLMTSDKIYIKSDKLRLTSIYFCRLNLSNFLRKGIVEILKKSKSILVSKYLINAYYAMNAYYDNLKGFDFYKIESLDELELKEETSEQYETTKPFELKDWLNYVPKDIEYAAIDFGSGKGSVLVELAKINNFKVIYGVEISTRLTEVARKNLRKININNIHLINIDAINTPMRVIDICNFFYFYNPFPYPVFSAVFNMIECSVKESNRYALIIYFNPVHCSVIESSPYFVRIHSLTNKLSRSETYIYKTIFDNK